MTRPSPESPPIELPWLVMVLPDFTQSTESFPPAPTLKVLESLMLVLLTRLSVTILPRVTERLITRPGAPPSHCCERVLLA